MKVSLEDRKAALEHLSWVLHTLHDGGPYADSLPDRSVLVLEEADRAPAAEFDALVDLLEDLPTPDELRGAKTNWGQFEAAVSQYLGAYVIRRPQDFAPVAERLVRAPRIGQAVLSALGDASYYPEFDSSPYLGALQRAMEPPYDEDQMLGLIGGLEQAISPRAIELLERLRSQTPPEETDHRRWIGEAIHRASTRVADEAARQQTATDRGGELA